MPSVDPDHRAHPFNQIIQSLAFCIGVFAIHIHVHVVSNPPPPPHLPKLNTNLMYTKKATRHILVTRKHRVTKSADLSVFCGYSLISVYWTLLGDKIPIKITVYRPRYKHAHQCNSINIYFVLLTQISMPISWRFQCMFHNLQTWYTQISPCNLIIYHYFGEQTKMDIVSVYLTICKHGTPRSVHVI